MYKQQNKLIDREPHDEGEPCRDKNVSHVPAVTLSPPLNNDSSDKNGKADRANADHDQVDGRASACEAIDRLGNCNVKLIHRFQWSAFGRVECGADRELNNNQAERRLNEKGLLADAAKPTNAKEALMTIDIGTGVLEGTFGRPAEAQQIQERRLVQRHPRVD